MGEIRSDWLLCKNYNRRGKYSFNTKNISYDSINKRLILNWNLNCKFCNTPLKLQNLGDSSISMLYALLLIRNIDGSV
jgi:hypothetical protein